MKFDAPPPEPEPYDAATTTTGASVLSGGLWQLLSRMLPQAYTLILSVAIARFLGVDEFGQQSYIAFVAISLNTFLSGGLKGALMRWVGELLGRREPATARGIAAWTLAIQTPFAVLGGVVMVASGVLGSEPELAWILAGVWVAVSTVQTIPNAVLLGGQRFRAAAMIGFVTDTIAVPTTIVVLALGGGVSGVFAVEAAVATINLIWTSIVATRMLRRAAPVAAVPPRTDKRPFLRYALIGTGSTLVALVLWRRSEFFFLESYSTDAQIGIYSVAFGFAAALLLIPQTLANVVAPALATLFGADDRERIESGFWRGTRLLSLFTLPITAAALALGPELLTVIYGDDFDGVGPVVLILVVTLPFVPLYEMAISLMGGFGRALAPFVLGAGAAVVNIGLDLLLIPDLEAIGAAIANTSAQLVLVLPALVYSVRLIGSFQIKPLTLARAAMVSALSGVAAWAALQAVGGIAGLVVGAAVGTAALVLLVRVVPVVDGADALWLEESAGSRLGGVVGRGVRWMRSTSATGW